MRIICKDRTTGPGLFTCDGWVPATVDCQPSVWPQIIALVLAVIIIAVIVIALLNLIGVDVWAWLLSGPTASSIFFIYHQSNVRGLLIEEDGLAEIVIIEAQDEEAAFSYLRDELHGLRLPCDCCGARFHRSDDAFETLEDAESWVRNYARFKPLSVIVHHAA